jgi:hypothetical protein
VTDPELLMAIMETREALEEAEMEDQVQQIRDENRGSSFALSRSLSRLLFSLLLVVANPPRPRRNDARNLLPPLHDAFLRLSFRRGA